MTEYRKAFDQKAPSLEAALLAIAPDLDRLLPGFDKNGIHRFINQFRILLGKVDAKKIKRPAYLAYGSPNLPQYLIDQLDQAINYASQGAAQFVQNMLPQLVDMQLRLERAVALPAQEIDEFHRGAVVDIASLIDKISEQSNYVDSLASEVEKNHTEVSKSVGLIDQRVQDTSKDFQAIRDIRKQVDLLASDDGRPAGTIERQLNAAKTKSDILNKLTSESQSSLDAIKSFYEEAKALSSKIVTQFSEIESLTTKANGVLLLATQAGLAASYTQERAKLLKQQDRYTIIFYLLIGAVALGAVIYIVPALENVVTRDHGATSAIETSIIALIRIGIFAPLIWAILFTSHRIQRLELLQLDYAEKAAASLAYSGYRSEMDTDPDLLHKLKNGLLLRFSEHPERLLQKNPPSSTVSISDKGFTATTATSDPNDSSD